MCTNKLKNQSQKPIHNTVIFDTNNEENMRWQSASKFDKHSTTVNMNICENMPQTTERSNKSKTKHQLKSHDTKQKKKSGNGSSNNTETTTLTTTGQQRVNKSSSARYIKIVNRPNANLVIHCRRCVPQQCASLKSTKSHSRSTTGKRT